MEKTFLIQYLIESLLEIPVFYIQTFETDVKTFCHRYKFHLCQKITDHEFLSTFLPSLHERIVYEVIDTLNFHYLIVRAKKFYCILGPYCVSRLMNSQYDTILAKNGLDVSYVTPYILYRSKFPVIPLLKIQNLITLLSSLFFEQEIPELETISLENSRSINTKIKSEATTKLNTLIDERYSCEKLLELAIREGNAKKAIYFSNKLLYMVQPITDRYSSIQDFLLGQAITRTIIRKAVDETLVPPIVIDAVTEACNQSLKEVTTQEEMTAITRKMLVEFCKLVKNAKLYGYSLPVRKAVAFISSNLATPFSVVEIAQQAGVSTSYLSSLMRKETGCTTQVFINKQRIKKAAELIKTTKIPIQEIGTYVGFNDFSYFIKMFHKYEFVSPAIYRKKYGM